MCALSCLGLKRHSVPALILNYFVAVGEGENRVPMFLFMVELLHFPQINSDLGCKHWNLAVPARYLLLEYRSCQLCQDRLDARCKVRLDGSC